MCVNKIVNNKLRVVNNHFNGQCFEKFKIVDNTTEGLHFCYAVDGIEVSQEDWRQQREAAIALSLSKLDGNK